MEKWLAPMERPKALRFAGILAVVVFAVDTVSKEIVLDVFRDPHVIEVTPFFNLLLVWNRGVSFGMFSSGSGWGPIALLLVAAVVVAALVIWLWRTPSRWAALAIGLVVGGAIGNALDRIRHGAVVDFLDFHAAGWHWPAFNAADCAICVGAALLVVESLFTPGKKS